MCVAPDDWFLADDRPIQHKNEVISFGAPRDASTGFDSLTVPNYKTRVVVEVVTTFSSFRFPELSQPI